MHLTFKSTLRSVLSLAAGFTLIACPGIAHAAEPGLRLAGAAKVDITPGYPVRLSGYGNRRTESEGVEQHIFAKALAIGSDEEGPAVVVTVDNCGVSASIRDEVVRRLKKKTRVTNDHFAICSSHTHSAPMINGVLPNLFGMDIPPEQLARIDQYTHELTDNIERAALEALANRRPSHLDWAMGKVAFAKNRRTKTAAGYSNKENPEGPTDHDLPVLRVTDADGKVQAIFVEYACHCTTVGFNRVHGDWAGCAQQFMERDFPGAVAMTALGCGGDQNPYPRGTYELANQHGEAMAAEVKRLLAGKMTPLTAKLACRTKPVELPFDTLPTHEEWEKKAQDKTAAIAYHAKKNLARLDRGEKIPTQLPYMVQVWNFGSELAMVFLPGEVVVDYSLRLKREFDASRLWVCAYSNDDPCYIPSVRILREGGYEGGGAMVYYDRPTRFAEPVEETIVGAVRALMPGEFLNPKKKANIPPPKSPAESLAAIRTKPDFTVELVAAEPLVVDPVAIDFGADGKLWVVEMRDYPMGIENNWKAGGRIKVLESTKSDGHYDKATVFLDNLPFPTGVMAWRKGALICAAPDILFAEDTDGDGRADVVRKVFSGFVTNNYQARVNGLSIGLDNWVYGANGLLGGIISGIAAGKTVDIRGHDFRMNPDTEVFEPVAGLSQQGRVRDDWGNWFGCDNSNLAWSFPLPDHYVKRNPHIVAPNPRVGVAGGADPNQLFPASETLERFNAPESANRTTSACGIGIYRDTLLGDDYYGDAFTCEPVHNLVHRLKLIPESVTFTGLRPSDEQRSEFFASADNWSRPVQVCTGPDGALWVVDMYRFVIEHPRWIPAEKLAQLDVRAGDDKGRIYRVYPKDKKLRAIPRLDKLSAPQVAAALDTPNGVVRDLVQRELFQRQDQAAVEPLKHLFQHASLPAVRVQALCILDGLKALTPELLVRALQDEYPDVRRQAVRLSEPWLAKSGTVADAVLKRTEDADLGVRYQLALSLGDWHDARAGVALGRVARSAMVDPWLRAAVLSSATQDTASILAEVLQSPHDAAGRGEMVGQLIATTVAAANNDALVKILQIVAPAKNQTAEGWQLVSLARLQDALDQKKIKLASFTKSNQTEIREAAERIQSAYLAAHALAASVQADEATRVAALHLFGRGFNEAEADLPLLVEYLKPEAGSALQQAALEMIRRSRSPKVPGLLLAGWAQQSPALRTSILDILISRPEWAGSLLDAVEQNRIAPAEIPVANRNRLLRQSDTVLKSRAEKLLAAQKSESRALVLAQYQTVPELKGDPAKGSEVFAKICSTCHLLKGQGHEVGPDISVMRNKTPQDFLVAILDPNAVIEPRFVNYLVETKDERSLSGVISAESATSITLAQSGGVRETIRRTDIASIRASTLSLMPEGLEQAIPPQDMANLIAYLKAEK